MIRQMYAERKIRNHFRIPVYPALFADNVCRMSQILIIKDNNLMKFHRKKSLINLMVIMIMIIFTSILKTILKQILMVQMNKMKMNMKRILMNIL